MLKRSSAFAALGLGLVLAWQVGRADDSKQVRHHAPACPPGCQVVAETCYKEVCRNVCKVVPDVVKVKKWVYTCVDDPFCIHNSGKKHGGLLHHKDCDTACPSCEGPLCRKQLVKREVVVDEICGTKCVVEKVVERVPYTVYHTLPCTTPCPPGMTVVNTAPGAATTVPAPNVEILKTPPMPLKK